MSLSSFLLNIVYILLKQQLLTNITCAEMVLSNNHAAVSNWKNSVASFISLARRFCNGLILRIHFSTAKTYRSKLIQVYFNLQKNVVVMAERNLFMQVKSLLKNEKVSISKEYNSNYYPHGHKIQLKYLISFICDTLLKSKKFRSNTKSKWEKLEKSL